MLSLRIRALEGHTFIVDNLGPGSVVVDLGMNKGAFSRYILETTAASIVGAEPVPALFEALPTTERIRTFNVALGAGNGTTTLRLYKGHCASTLYGMVKKERAAAEIEVPLVSFARFRAMAGLRSIQLLKVDIEGAELDLFETLSDAEYADIEQITVEFHDFLDPSHVPRIQAILERMRKLSFHTINISLRHHADVLCINTKALPLSPIARAQLQVSKLIQAAVRVPRRHLLGLSD
jgi:FkbM family methyltransferase